jgi:hypothetical protein
MLFTPWLNLIKSALRKRPRAASPAAASGPARSERIERLEDRTLLSVSSFFNPNNDQLFIFSNAGDDMAVTVSAGTVQVNGIDTGVAAGSVQTLNVLGGPGGNDIDLSGVLAADFTDLTGVTITGSDAADTIVGSEFNDILLGKDGNDSIDGGRGTTASMPATATIPSPATTEMTPSSAMTARTCCKAEPAMTARTARMATTQCWAN